MPQDPYSSIAQPIDPYASIAVAPPSLDLSDPRTVPNARIRNMTVDPTKDIHSPGQALYEGAKMGVLAASIPGVVYSTIPQLVGAVIGGTAGSAGAKKLAEAVGVGDFGQEIASDLGNLAGGALGAGTTDAAVSAIRQARLGNALQNVLGMASKDVIARIPVLGHLVRRPALQDYIGAWKAGRATPEPVYPGAPEPTATPEQLNPSLISPSRSLPGQIGPEVIRPAAQPIPARTGLMLPGQVEPAAAAPGAAGSMAESVAQPSVAATPSGAGIPRTLHGESILNQALGGRDQPTLLKIARSRGINVTQEAQLKPGVANKRLIGKIIDDFSPEELEDIRAQGIENARFRHAFGDIGEEAWNTMALQTYFPDVKIPMAQLMRTQKAIQSAAAPKFAPVSDLAAQLKESTAVNTPNPKPAGSAGSLEDSLNAMLKGVKSGKTLKDLAAR